MQALCLRQHRRLTHSMLPRHGATDHGLSRGTHLAGEIKSSTKVNQALWTLQYLAALVPADKSTAKIRSPRPPVSPPRPPRAKREQPPPVPKKSPTVAPLAWLARPTTARCSADPMVDGPPLPRRRGLLLGRFARCVRVTRRWMRAL